MSTIYFANKLVPVILSADININQATKTFNKLDFQSLNWSFLSLSAFL